MRLFLANATSDKKIRLIISRALCMGVVGLKLAPPLIQKKWQFSFFYSDRGVLYTVKSNVSTVKSTHAMHSELNRYRQTMMMTTTTDDTI